MIYISNKQKVKDMIDNLILPSLKKKDIDYELLINALIKETSVSRNIVEEILASYVPNQMKEVRYFTIPENQIVGLIQELRAKEAEIKKEVESAGI